MSKRAPDRPDRDVVWVTEYRHWRTGEIMRAADYGYRAWPFRKRKR